MKSLIFILATFFSISACQHSSSAILLGNWHFRGITGNKDSNNTLGLIWLNVLSKGLECNFRKDGILELEAQESSNLPYKYMDNRISTKNKDGSWEEYLVEKIDADSLVLKKKDEAIVLHFSRK